MTALQRYAAVKEMMALLSGSMREDVLASVPQAGLNLIYGLQITEEELLKNPSTKTGLEKLQQTIYEYEQLKTLVPLTSYETIGTINEKLSILQEQFQNIVTYEPTMFYNIYFCLNGATQKTVNEKPLFKPIYGMNTSFDKWFEGSIVVDEKNEPLIVFHGTGASDFSRFTFDVFPGAYFAENRTYSEWFRKVKGGSEGVLFECFLRIMNPIDLRLFKTNKVTYNEFVSYIELKYGYVLPENTMLRRASEQSNGLWAWQYLRGAADWLKLISNEGIFDGFAFYENNPQDIIDGEENITPAWMVFKPQQIKAAHGNVTFSHESEDIRFKKGGEL